MQVDLDAIIKSRLPKVYRFTPRFIFTAIKKVIRQDKINDVLKHSKGLEGVEFITSSLDYMNISRVCIGKDNIDPNGHYMFASNHPLGGLDGLILVEAISSFKGGAKIVVNDLLMVFEMLRNCFIPINKFGRQSTKYTINLNEEIASESQIIYFPSGLCSRKIKGEVKDLDWQKSFIQKAIDSNRDIVPLFVDDLNSNFFYSVENIRKKLGIKLNIGMILLPSEMFASKGVREVRVFFGEPIKIETIINSELSINQWSDIIRKKCYDLKPC